MGAAPAGDRTACAGGSSHAAIRAAGGRRQSLCGGARFPAAAGECLERAHHHGYAAGAVLLCFGPVLRRRLAARFAAAVRRRGRLPRAGISVEILRRPAGAGLSGVRPDRACGPAQLARPRDGGCERAAVRRAQCLVELQSLLGQSDVQCVQPARRRGLVAAKSAAVRAEHPLYAVPGCALPVLARPRCSATEVRRTARTVFHARLGAAACRVRPACPGETDRSALAAFIRAILLRCRGAGAQRGAIAEIRSLSLRILGNSRGDDRGCQPAADRDMEEQPALRRHRVSRQDRRAAAAAPALRRKVRILRRWVFAGGDGVLCLGRVLLRVRHGVLACASR